MKPLHQDPWFTFRFADDRLIARFHLDGVPPGRRVSVIKIDPRTDERLGLLATATVGIEGWVQLSEPIVMRTGEAFIAVPDTAPLIRPETSADHDGVYRVNRLAFGQDDEANLVEALRAGGYTRLSLVAELEGQLVGHILFSELPIVGDSGTVASLALAPMAVLPEFQNRGIGSALVRHGLDACRQQGHRIVVVLGHPHFYPRFGFSLELARQLESPFPREAFMAVELTPGAMNGVRGRVCYPPPFGIA